MKNHLENHPAGALISKLQACGPEGMTPELHDECMTVLLGSLMFGLSLSPALQNLAENYGNDAVRSFTRDMALASDEMLSVMGGDESLPSLTGPAAAMAEACATDENGEDAAE